MEKKAHVDLIQKCLSEGRWDDARDSVEAALREFPLDEEIQMQYGWLRYDQMRYEEAEGIFGRIAATPNPIQAKAWEWKIRSMRMQGKYDAADVEISTALAKFKDDADLEVQRGRIQFDQKHYAAAADILWRIAKRNPGNANAWEWRIRSLMADQRYGDAEGAVNAALKALPGDENVLMQLAWLRYAQQLYKEAASGFGDVEARYPKNREASELKIQSLRLAREFDMAQDAIDAALAERPGKPEILMQLAWLRNDEKRFKEAFEILENITTQDPGFTPAQDYKIKTLRAEGNYEQAEKAIDAALAALRDREPAMYPFLMLRGWLLYDEGKYAQCLEVFNEIKQRYPQYLEADFACAEVLAKSNRKDQALQILQSLKQKYPENLDVRAQLAWLCLNLHDYGASEDEFNLIQESDPKNIMALNGLGAVRFYQGRFDDSLEFFKKVVAVEPLVATWQANLAWALVRQEEDRNVSGEPETRLSRSELAKIEPTEPSPLDEAEALCRKALELDARYGAAYGCLGRIAFRRGRLRDAETNFVKWNELDPKGGNHAELGALYVQMGRVVEAEKEFNNALELDRDDSVALTELANLYLQQGKSRKAVDFSKQARARDPDNEVAVRSLALALIQLKDYDGAEQVLRTALRRLDAFKRWQLHYTLSVLLTNLGEKADDSKLYDEALDEIRKAMGLKPDQASLYFQRGYIRAKITDYKGAQRDFNECLELDEDHFQARRNVTKLRELTLKAGAVQHSSSISGYFVSVLSIAMLLYLWFYYLRQPADVVLAKQKVTDQMLEIMTPLLLFIAVVGVLLPSLIRLKLGALVAELSPTKQTNSQGPSGDAALNLSNSGGSENSLSSLK